MQNNEIVKTKNITQLVFSKLQTRSYLLHFVSGHYPNPLIKVRLQHWHVRQQQRQPLYLILPFFLHLILLRLNPMSFYHILCILQQIVRPVDRPINPGSRVHQRLNRRNDVTNLPLVFNPLWRDWLLKHPCRHIVIKHIYGLKQPLQRLPLFLFRNWLRWGRPGPW